MNAAPPPAAAPMPFPPGTVIAGGKYRVNRLLGEGGMGWVVVATHLQLEQRVALKFMRSANNPEAGARFLREARAAARIQSEHVARVSDVGTLENGSPYLVMEYLEGEDLAALIDAKGALPDYLAIDYAMQACEGLAEAHAAGIVHRDLKPANLFLARRTDGSVRVKLLDFGISKLAPAPGSQPEIHMTSTQALMGSPLYMAPEQMRSSRSVDRRADIWSMGTIIYEMLTGHSPFEGDSLPEVCARILSEAPASILTYQPDLPPELDAVVLRCLEKKPEERYPDVAALAKALSTFGTDEIRSTAQRIERVKRVDLAPLSESYDDEPTRVGDMDVESAAVTNPLARQHELLEGPDDRGTTPMPKTAVAATHASFSRGEATGAKRPGSSRLALARGGVAAAVVLAIAFVALRGPQAEPAATGATVASAGTRAVAETTATASAPVVTESAIPTMAVTALPRAPAAPSTAPNPVPVTPLATAALVAPPAPVRVAPATRSTVTPAGAAPKPAPKPASTTGFGGRD
jgi:serine/threonine-protein kinase